MRFSAILVFLSCIGLLGGCANPNLLVVGQSSVADVRARMGTPTDTHVDRNGDQLLEYATGPEGHETYRVRVGADGKVKDVTRLLTEEQLAKVVLGTMKRDEVRDLLGRPSFEDAYMAGPTWSWRYKRGGVSPGYMVVTFNPDGTAQTKIVIIDPSGDSPMD
jgi:hypothetical protein